MTPNSLQSQSVCNGKSSKITTEKCISKLENKSVKLWGAMPTRSLNKCGSKLTSLINALMFFSFFVVKKKLRLNLGVFLLGFYNQIRRARSSSGGNLVIQVDRISTVVFFMRLSIFQSKISGHCVQFLSVPFY
jgi:hypothetical protein